MGSVLAALLPTTAGISWLLSSSVKAALLLAASWLGAALLRRGTAAARHQIWALGVAGALLLPLLCRALPSLPLWLGPPTIGAGSSLLATAVFVTGGRTTSAGPAWPAWSSGLAVAWAAGALLVSLRFLRGHLAARRLSRAAQPAHAEAWLSARREAAASLAIAGEVGLGRSEAIGSPMTIGVLRPRVLLPAAADGWSPQRLRAVLMHELGHVRRHDTLIQLLAQVGCALYWWNPLAWLAAARLRIEREHACDDLVLGAGIRPSSYAADLLEVARCISPDEAAHAGAVCMVDLSWTEARLRRILDSTAPRGPLGARFRLAARGATLAFAVTLACTSAPLEVSPAAAPPSRAVALRTPLGRPLAPAEFVPAAEGEERKQVDEYVRAPRGSLSVGAPSVRDSGVTHAVRSPASAADRTLDLVAKEVESHMGDLKQCYERRLLVHPELSGMVVMHWNITATGEVSEMCVTEDTLGDAAVIACVNKLVEDSWFPPARGWVDVSFPFVFTAAP
ncbi:MAG: antirepressor regulating drug resistance protein [Myxococcales bacterium]|nr:antirepressor regulating drug resistance protein [Myxococcales bacterium]